MDSNLAPKTVPTSRRHRRVVLVADRQVEGVDLGGGPNQRDVDNEVAVVVRPFESFDLFVVTHSKTLVRCAYLIVGDAGTAQDVVQIALVKVAKRWESVVAGGHPLPYVRSAVVHAAISWRRRKWHGEVPTGPLPDHAGVDEVGAVDNRDRLRRALAELPRRQRAAVVLRHYLDLDEAATAAVIGADLDATTRWMDGSADLDGAQTLQVGQHVGLATAARTDGVDHVLFIDVSSVGAESKPAASIDLPGPSVPPGPTEKARGTVVASDAASISVSIVDAADQERIVSVDLAGTPFYAGDTQCVPGTVALGAEVGVAYHFDAAGTVVSDAVMVFPSA